MVRFIFKIIKTFHIFSGSRANITQIRIQGCAAEPCTLKKGKRLPFEIDFNFQAPQAADEISVSAFAPYWNVPGQGAYGTNLAGKNTGKCSDFSLECPAPACRQLPCNENSYTLKSYLYADRRLQQTVGNKKKTVSCQPLKFLLIQIAHIQICLAFLLSQGKVNTSWLFTPRSNNSTNNDEGSQCSFYILFNLVQ